MVGAFAGTCGLCGVLSAWLVQRLSVLVVVRCLSVIGAAAVCTGNGVVSVCGCVLSF